MPSFSNVLLCAFAEALISLCVGLPVTRRVVAERPLALTLAPIVGWAVFNGLALPILSILGFSRLNAALLSGAAVLFGLAILPGRPARSAEGGGDVPVWAYGAAALLAILPALAVWPKCGGGGVVLSEAMFDHSKAAIIDDIVRLGLPPGNPFFNAPEPRLVYYYLWHFSAAIPATLCRASGWEADIALTWFTAFASLNLMMGLAAWFGRRSLAAPLVLLLSLGASLRPMLRLVFSDDFLARALSEHAWPQGWLFQASWSPQHLASASCVIAAVVVMARLPSRRSWPLVPLLAVVAAAGFESSAWVGGIVFAAAALPIGVLLLVSAADGRARLDLLLEAAVAVILAALLSSAFLHDEAVATLSRHGGAPIALVPFEVLGPLVPEKIRSVLDLPAYWTILMVLQFPAVYFAGAWAMADALARKDTVPAQRRLFLGSALLAAASFIVAAVFASTIANNDLGWRGVLPGVLVLTIFAAAGLSRWLATAPALAATALTLWALAVPGGLQVIGENAVGLPARSATGLAEAPELWAAVRRYTAPDERVANNPLSLADSVRWPVNISWALLADRRSCYAGWNLARAFVPLPEVDIDRINIRFERFFAGYGSPDDLLIHYDCRVAVVTPSDGAWQCNPFAGSRYFRLVDEKPDRWRIYRVVEGVRERR
jgi:hypothetical protein